MASHVPHGPYIIYVDFDVRDDGGLRATCDRVPSFLLSHRDHDKVRADVVPALEAILSEIYGMMMKVEAAAELGDDDQYLMPAHLCGKQGYIGVSVSR